MSSKNFSKDINMTLLSTLGYSPNKKSILEIFKTIIPKNISIVIPVKNNQIGIDRFLAEFTEVTSIEHYPQEIIIIDNNSTPALHLPNDYPVSLILSTCKDVGPAAARNKGVSLAKGEWILFTDSDCIPTPSTISGYCTNHNNKVLAYAGGIDIVSDDYLSRYYKTQETLIPPEAIYLNKKRPDYLVTANCLIQKSAIIHVGFFDTAFKQAGGEDIDLAFRLLEVGEIDYQFSSCTRHDFDDGFTGFINRFKRYGRGNRQLALKYQLDLKPTLFLPAKISPVNILLALAQYLSMRVGYQKGGLE